MSETLITAPQSATPQQISEALVPVAPQEQMPIFGFSNTDSFEHLQRVAKMFSKSALVPQVFQGDAGFPNCVIALEMASRMGASPLAVMQNIYIVYNKPGWSSQFLISCVNTCGRFEPLQFEVFGEGDDFTFIAWTTRRGVRLPQRKDNLPWTLDRVREAGLNPYAGPPCSIGMAKAEGWFSKNGSKWKTMPELMLHYRAATFFVRLFAPELTMGMKTAEEIIDIDSEVVHPKRPAIDGPSADDAASGQDAVTKAIATIESAAATPQAPPYEVLCGLIKSSNVNEDQVLAFCKQEKMCRHDLVELMQVSDTKLRNLCQRWTNALPFIQKIQI